MKAKPRMVVFENMMDDGVGDELPPSLWQGACLNGFQVCYAVTDAYLPRPRGSALTWPPNNFSTYLLSLQMLPLLNYLARDIAKPASIARVETFPLDFNRPTAMAAPNKP